MVLFGQFIILRNIVLPCRTVHSVVPRHFEIKWNRDHCAARRVAKSFLRDRKRGRKRCVYYLPAYTGCNTKVFTPGRRGEHHHLHQEFFIVIKKRRRDEYFFASDDIECSFFSHHLHFLSKA